MITRGFTGRHRSPDIAKRLPPGQSLTTDFPVLSEGPTPHISAAEVARRQASGEPAVVEEGPKTEFNDISFTLTSTPLVVPAGGEKSHAWELYAGPKRKELLSPLGADGVLDLGWFAIVSQGMLWILEKLHSFGIPYGIAIICLTIIVRGALFPLSRKQAIGAAKMKDLQPKPEPIRDVRQGPDGAIYVLTDSTAGRLLKLVPKR